MKNPSEDWQRQPDEQDVAASERFMRRMQAEIAALYTEMNRPKVIRDLAHRLAPQSNDRSSK